jgi:hypothetical protein
MNFEQINLHLNAYKEHDQILDAAKYLISSFNLEHENFAGFGFRQELSPNSMLLTAEGELGHPQMVMIPKNIFDFDTSLFGHPDIRKGLSERVNHCCFPFRLNKISPLCKAACIYLFD